MWATERVTDTQRLRLEPIETLAALTTEWKPLAERSGNVFATSEWLTTWWRHFGRDRPLHLSVGRDHNGAITVILPLYLAARRPLRVMRFLGHGPSDELGPVCDPSDRITAAHALRAHIEDLEAGWDVAIADELPGAGAWARTTGARLMARTPSPIVRIAGASWNELLAARSAQLRQQLRRKHRRLATLGRVTFRSTDDPQRLQADLTTFFALHAARWAHTGGSRSFARREAFHRDFAAQALEQGWLRLRFLELDGRAVAALYNLRFAAAESNYQAGRDPAFAAQSVGLLLHAHAIEAACDDGLAEYRFLRGGETYKDRFADHDPGLETIGFARTAIGRSALRAVQPVPRLPRALRRRIPAAYAWGTGGSPIWGRP